MRVAIRTDAAAAIGLGHIKRCLSLAHVLREAGAEVAVVMAKRDIDVSAFVRQAGCEYIQIAQCLGFENTGVRKPAACSFAGTEEDARQTVEALAKWMPEWVIVDHYNLDADWHSQVRQSLNAKIAAIDDLADRTLAAEVIINHNFSEDHHAKYKALISSGSKILGGPRFALLGQSYVYAQPYQFRETVQSIGVFMGGTDPVNASTMVLAACRTHGAFQGSIEIATTSANPHFASLEAACKQWPNTKLLVDESELSGFFARHDLQIGAGGGATWERCCMGAPTLALICAENQNVVIPALHRLGVLETVSQVSHKAIGEAVRKLIDTPDRRRHLNNASRLIVDGHGAKRVALALLANTLTVRPVERADMSVIFKWRNHPATRETSHDNKEIAWETHVNWLVKSLGNSQRLLLIAEIGKYPVGVIRFDLHENDAELSIYLDPDAHALGLGKQLLRAGEVSALRQWSHLRTFVAEVLEYNIGSRQLFISANYKQLKPDVFVKQSATDNAL